MRARARDEERLAEGCKQVTAPNRHLGCGIVPHSPKPHSSRAFAVCALVQSRAEPRPTPLRELEPFLVAVDVNVVEFLLAFC